MNLHEVQSRLRIYEAITGPVNDRGETLARVDGELHEVNVNEVLQWIPGTRKELERTELFLMKGWDENSVLARKKSESAEFRTLAKESAKEFRTQALKVPELRGRLESVRVRLLELKHKPGEKGAEVESIRADIKQIGEQLTERTKEHERDGQKYARAYVKAVLRYKKAKPTGVELSRLEGSPATWSRKLKDRYVLGQILLLLDREMEKKSENVTLLLNAKDEIEHLKGRPQDAMAPATDNRRKCQYCESEWAEEGETICETCKREVLHQEVK